MSIKLIANPKIYLDEYWQTPVITEKKVRDLIDGNRLLAKFDNYRLLRGSMGYIYRYNDSKYTTRCTNYIQRCNQ
jgi:hypothetical protein